MKTAVVLLAEGFEEIEGITPVDFLRRAGINVLIASVSGDQKIGPSVVFSARKIGVTADIGLDQIPKNADCLIIPGGQGAGVIAASSKCIDLINSFYSEGKLIAAICAAPAVVLSEKTKILKGKKATCYPGLENRMDPQAVLSEERVVVDGNIITSRAAGTSGEFSLAVITKLLSQEDSNKIKASVLLK